MYFDPTFVLLLPVLLFAVYAQFKVKSTFDKYSRVASRNGYSGRETARALLKNNIRTSAVQIETIPGVLTDHFDPRTNTLRLSAPVYDSRSISAVSVAAHEAGHVMQQSERYFPMRIRSTIVPVASFGSYLAFPLFIFGILFSFKPLIDIGILFFTAAVLFHIVTLPVEYNASARAITMLEANGIIMREETIPAREVLNAAALTYVAAAAMSLVQLLRMLMIRDRD
jgi:uncharacterized protein